MITVFVFRVEVRAFIIGTELFECRTFKFEGKDTGKSIMVDGKRITKENFNNVQAADRDSTRSISFSMYTFEDEIESAKTRLIEKIQEHAKMRLAEMQKLSALTERTPVETFRDETE